MCTEMNTLSCWIESQEKKKGKTGIVLYYQPVVKKKKMKSVTRYALGAWT